MRGAGVTHTSYLYFLLSGLLSLAEVVSIYDIRHISRDSSFNLWSYYRGTGQKRYCILCFKYAI